MQQTDAKTESLAVGSDYRDDVQLRPDLRVRFRSIKPADKVKVAAGFERLSAESRYRRFFASKNTLSPAELRFFTEPDGVNHIAIGAVAIDARGREGEGVGIGHLVRLPDEPEVAELALAVADPWQGQGFGRMLLARLIAAARERGIRRIRAHLLVENARMRQLIERDFGEIDFSRDGELLTGEFPIPPMVDAPATSRDWECAPLHRLLRLVAEGSIMPATLGLRGLREGMAWMAPFRPGGAGLARKPED